MNNDKKKLWDLGIITTEPFPVGMAATNRIITYSKELAKSLNVKVYILKPTENVNSIRNEEPKGMYSGISFEYVSGSTIWPYRSNKMNKLYIIVKYYPDKWLLR